MTDTRRRRNVLAAVVAAVGVVTGIILLEVLGTVVLAITVAYVLVPVHRWLVRRGLSDRTAGAAASAIGFAGAVAVLAPIFAALYWRRDELVAVVRSLPEAVTLTAFETSVTVEAATVQDWLVDRVQEAAVSLATAAPELAVKVALFVLLLYALLVRGEAAARAAIAPVPPAYRPVAVALAERARETLYAIYVIQLATAGMTLAVAYPFFWMLGYDGAFVLAMLAGLLQFVPIVGPSFLLAPIALYHAAVGDVGAAALVGALGLPLIGWLPDVVVRPRMAESTAGLPGSLYFVGFTGGLFTLGPIGIVVGPLIVAVFAEAVALLAAEVDADEVPSIPEPTGTGDEPRTGAPAGEPPADPAPAEPSESPAGTDHAGRD